MCESLPEYPCTTCKVGLGVTVNCELPRGCWNWLQLLGAHARTGFKASAFSLPSCYATGGVPLVGFHSSAPAHTPFLGKSTEGSSIQFLPELQTSSQPGLCVASGQTATGCASYTGRLGWPAGDRQAVGSLGRMECSFCQKRRHQSRQQLWAASTPTPPAWSSPATSSSPLVLQKDAEEKGAGLENNICWILNIWMKLTKKIMNTHSGWGDIRVEVILLRS